MSMENLKCSVTDCHYQKDMRCTAEKIEVATSGDGVARSSEGTMCRTFKPKNNK